MTDLQVKTCWQFAEQAGYARPEAMQRLLYRARWDADAVRDDVCRVLVDRFGDPDGVLVVDETGMRAPPDRTARRAWRRRAALIKERTGRPVSPTKCRPFDQCE